LTHVRIRCTGLVIKDDSVLLVEYDDNGIHYNLPGGGLEPGETIKDGVVREVYEETEAEVEVGDLALIYEFAPHKQSGDYEETTTHGVHFIFECTLKNDSIPKFPRFPDPHQSAVKWIPLDNLEEILLIPNINKQIMEYAKNKRTLKLIEDYQLDRLKIIK